MNLSYRARQFFLTITASPSTVDLRQVGDILSPPLMGLFLKMQPSEQAHSIQVMRKLQRGGYTHPDLLAAALLHDVGKSLQPLSAWERVMIVLSKTFFPIQARQWGRSEDLGWKRAWVVADRHPAWGAELAALAGANPTVTRLIRRHQDTPPAKPYNLGDHWLIQLQLADDES